MKPTRVLALFAISGMSLARAGGSSAKPADPGDSAADMSKPVKVFVMLGQSNMVGMGHIAGTKPGSLQNAVTEQKLYPYLVDGEGNWARRKDVRYVQVMVGAGNSMVVVHNEWLEPDTTFTKSSRSPDKKNKISDAPKAGKAANIMGVEHGVGHILGNAYEEPIMLLKSCIGNRALGWDLLPPGSKGFDFAGADKAGNPVTYTYAGYGESPMKWVKGTSPTPVPSWHAGIQYDWDIGHAKKVLADLNTYYPGAKSHEVAGFFFWQGEKDCGDAGLASRYEENLVKFIKKVREDFKAPDAKFVLGTLGESTKDSKGSEGKVFAAHMAVDGDSGKYPEFKGNVATIYTHDMARGGSGNGHYGHDCRVYMDVGEAMGEAMHKLLER